MYQKHQTLFIKIHLIINLILNFHFIYDNLKVYLIINKTFSNYF